MGQGGRMTMRRAMVAALAGGVIAFLWGTMASAETAKASVEMANDPAQGERLYGEYCASCHGANLEGQPNWQSAGEDGRFPAPPHDASGHTWHHSDALLFSYTKFGGQAVMAEQGVAFDSAMPGFGDRLSDRDIWDILAFIRSTWPERMRQIQEERTNLGSE